MCRSLCTCADPRHVVLQHVLQSRVLIQACPSPSDMPCSGTPEATHVLNITAPVGDKEVKRIFRPLRRVKILEFSGIPPTLFAGWANEADKRRFYRRIREFGAIWCCVHAHPVRHISHQAMRCRKGLTLRLLSSTGTHLVRLAV